MQLAPHLDGRRSSRSDRDLALLDCSRDASLSASSAAWSSGRRLRLSGLGAHDRCQGPLAGRSASVPSFEKDDDERPFDASAEANAEAEAEAFAEAYHVHEPDSAASAMGAAEERRLERIQARARSCICPDAVVALRYRAGLVVTNATFRSVVLVLIALNSMMMGLATFDCISDHPDRSRAFAALDRVFLLLFTLELAMNMAYHGASLFCSSWLTFDFVIVTASWLFQELTVVRSFRCLRLITHIQALQDLIGAILNVMPRMCGVAMLLALVFYVFAVMFTEFFKDCYRDGYTTEDYFGRLDMTMLTLFQIMTLDSWSLLNRDLMKANKWAWIPMVVFVVISSFIFINLIIAVICDAVAELHHQEIERDVMNHLASRELANEEMGIVEARQVAPPKPNAPAATAMDAAATAAAADAMQTTSKDIKRLEKKVDELTRLVQMLLSEKGSNECTNKTAGTSTASFC